MQTLNNDGNSVDSNTQDKINFLYSNIRRQIEHEDNLVNQRLTWLLAAQAFLFTGYYSVASNKEHFTGQLYIVIVICTLGIILTLATYNGILAAFKSLRMLYTSWYSFILQEKLCPCLRSTTEDYSTNDLLESRHIRLKETIDNELLIYYGCPQITWRGNGFFSAATTASLFPSTLVSVWISLFALKISESMITFHSTSGFIAITIFLVVTAILLIIMQAYLFQNR